MADPASPPATSTAPPALEIYVVEGQAPAGVRWEETDLGQRLLALHRRAGELEAEWAALQEHQRRLEADLEAHHQRRAAQGGAAAEGRGDALSWNLQFIPGFDDEPPPPIDDPELAGRCAATADQAARLRGDEAQLQTARAELQQVVAPLALRPLTLRQLLHKAREDHLRALPPRLLVVAGPVIFRYPFRRRVARVAPDGRALRVARVTAARWLVHQAPDGLWLVRQQRRALQGEALRRAQADDERLREELQRLRQRLDLELQPLPRFDPTELVESPVDAGRWLARVDGPLAAPALLALVDALLRDEGAAASPHDEAVLPLLLRRALTQRGVAVDG